MPLRCLRNVFLPNRADHEPVFATIRQFGFSIEFSGDYATIIFPKNLYAHKEPLPQYTSHCTCIGLYDSNRRRRGFLESSSGFIAAMPHSTAPASQKSQFFYGRKPDTSPKLRFFPTHFFSIYTQIDHDNDTPFVGVIKDCPYYTRNIAFSAQLDETLSQLWSTMRSLVEITRYFYHPEKNRAVFRTPTDANSWIEKSHTLGQSLRQQCREGLERHFPDWKNPQAYWDSPELNAYELFAPLPP